MQGRGQAHGREGYGHRIKSVTHICVTRIAARCAQQAARRCAALLTRAAGAPHTRAAPCERGLRSRTQCADIYIVLVRMRAPRSERCALAACMRALVRAPLARHAAHASAHNTYMLLCLVVCRTVLGKGSCPALVLLLLLW